MVIIKFKLIKNTIYVLFIKRIYRKNELKIYI